MGPDRDFYSAPGQENIRMMPLVFDDCADFIRESQSLLEIEKREGASDVVIVDDLPVRDFFEKVVEVNTF